MKGCIGEHFFQKKCDLPKIFGENKITPAKRISSQHVSQTSCFYYLRTYIVDSNLSERYLFSFQQIIHISKYWKWYIFEHNFEKLR